MILSRKASSSRHLNRLSEKLPRTEVSAFSRLCAQYRITFRFSAELSALALLSSSHSAHGLGCGSPRSNQDLFLPDVS